MPTPAEVALHECEARYRGMLDLIGEVVFRTDGALRFTYLNQTWERLTGHRVGTSTGQSLLAYLHPDDRQQTETLIQEVMAGKREGFATPLRLTSRQGEIRWIQATARPIPGPEPASRPIGLYGTLDDITSRKVAELTLRNINHDLEARVRLRTAELETSNRELEAFSYSVSHDLRAPLRSIDGFARILEEELGDRLDPTSRTHLERIRQAAGRMAYLIDSLIELARLSRHALRRETVNLSDLAVQIADDLKREEPDRVAEVEITRDLTVTADRTLLYVALENLLRNAWKFTSQCAVARIGFHADLDADDRRIFIVSDNGVGFDMAFAKQLFRPFQRLHDPSEYPGSGIGLANVQRIIQRHGGEIWAESTPGEGTRFHFTLDL